MRLEATSSNGTEARQGQTRRRCAVTRAHRPKDDLIRFVLAPDGAVVPDLKEKLPGRGVWLTAANETIADAVKCKAFGRALKAEAKVPDSLATNVEALLNEAALGALAIANKAGEVVFGHSKIEEALAKTAEAAKSASAAKTASATKSASATKTGPAKGGVIALVHASEAAADGCRKLDGRARAITQGHGLPAICIFTADELSLASGRANVIHAALIQGGAARKFLAEASRVERYRKGISAFADQNGLDTDQE